MNVVFLGSDEFALPTLEALAACQRHRVVGVVSQPDRPAGRGRHLRPTPVAQWTAGHGLPLICPASINKPEPRATLAGWGGEVGVVIAFGQKIGNEVLAIFQHGCINLHSSLLPKYRGAAPVAWAMINGEPESGLTVFRLVEKMDAGPIVLQRATVIGPTETAEELTNRLAAMGPAAMLGALDAIAAGTATFAPQDDRLACPAPKLSKHDGVLDWNQSAMVIANRIRGLYPWPGAHARFIGRSGRSEELLLARAVAEAASARSQFGSEVGVIREDLCVAAGLGAVRLIEVKPAGGRLMSFADYVNGRHVKPGDRMIPPEIPTLPTRQGGAVR